MKMDEYSSIRSYRQLREIRRHNRAEVRAVRRNIEKEICAVLDSLSPKSMLQELMQAISPLVDLYRLFKGFRL